MEDTRVMDPNTIPTSDGDVTVTGDLIGRADSSRLHHNHAGEFVEPGRENHCSTCRFYEVRIFKDDSGTEPAYIVVTMGHTIVPGEKVFTHIRRVTSPHEVLEVLTVRKPGKEPYLSKSNALALAQAAHADRALEDAYLNRGVV